MEIQSKAKYFAVAINRLYYQRGVRGKLMVASRGARYISLRIRLHDPLQMQSAMDLASNLALATSTISVRAERDQDYPGLISYQFELPSSMWQSYTRQDLTGLGIGFSDSRHQVDFSLEDEPHTLVAGSTGCGKSVTVASILLGLCQTLKPPDFKLIVVDPVNDYVDFANEAHLLLPLAHEGGEIDSAIGYAHDLYVQRKRSNIKDDFSMLLTVDEAEDTLGVAHRLAMVQELARGGRKFGIHLLVATQRPKQAKLPELINQLNNRLIGKCDNAQTSVLLSGRPGLCAHKLSSGGGDFIHVNGTIRRFQVAMPTQADYDHLERAEVGWLEAPSDVRVVENPEDDNPAQYEYVTPAVGRPATQLNPKALAYYLLKGPGRITQREAKEILSLARYAHVSHRDFALAVVYEIQRLLAERKESIPHV